MVEDVVTDGRRIAELLASELIGLAVGPLADVAVVDANPDVEPTPDGALAYAVAFDGDRVGAVRVRPNAAVLELGATWPVDVARNTAGLHLEDDELVIERGAAVKGAVDVLREALSA